MKIGWEGVASAAGWMARRDEGSYSQKICNRGATKPDAPPRRKTARDIFKTRSEAVNELGSKIVLRTNQITAITQTFDDPQTIDIKALKRATNLLAEDMEAFVARMEVEIPLYSEAAKAGIESWTHATNLLTDFGADHKREIAASLDIVRQALVSLQKMEQGNARFIEIIASTPRVTSALNRARRRTTSTLERLGHEVNVSTRLLSELVSLFVDLLEKNQISSEPS